MKDCSYNTYHYEPTQADDVHASLIMNKRVPNDAYQDFILYKLHQVEGI